MFKICLLILCVICKIHADCQFKCNDNNPAEVEMFGTRLLCSGPGEICNKFNLPDDIDPTLCKPCIEDPLCGECDNDDIKINNVVYSCPEYEKCKKPTNQRCAKCEASCDNLQTLKCDSLTTGTISGGAHINCTVAGSVCNVNKSPPCGICISTGCAPQVYVCDPNDPSLITVDGAAPIYCKDGKICNQYNIQPCDACIDANLVP